MSDLHNKVLTIANISLGYQLSGALILGWALATTSNAAIEKLSGTFWDYSVPAIESLVDQRTDARFGVVLLVIGILLQVFDNIFELTVSGSPKCLRTVCILFFITLVSAYPFVRTATCKNVSEQIIANIKKNSQ